MERSAQARTCTAPLHLKVRVASHVSMSNLPCVACVPAHLRLLGGSCVAAREADVRWLLSTGGAFTTPEKIVFFSVYGQPSQRHSCCGGTNLRDRSDFFTVLLTKCHRDITNFIRDSTSVLQGHRIRGGAPPREDFTPYGRFDSSLDKVSSLRHVCTRSRPSGTRLVCRENCHAS